MPPLETTTAEVRLGKLDTKTSDKLAVPGTLAVAENVEVVATGKYQRRPGTKWFATRSGTTRLHDGERELLAGTQDTLYSHYGGAFNSRGSIAGYKTRHTPIANSLIEQAGHNYVKNHGGYDWHVWEESTGVFYSVRDAVTGAYVVSVGTIATGTGQNRIRARIAAANSWVFITWVESDTRILRGRRIAVATPAAPDGVFAIEAAWSVNTWGSYDLVPRGGTGFSDFVTIAYMQDSTGHKFRLIEWNVNTQSVSASGFSNSIGTAGAHVDYAVSFLKFDTLYYVAIAWRNTTGSAGVVYLQSVFGLGDLPKATVAIYTTVNNDQFYNVTGFVEAANNTVHILAELETSGASTRPQLWYWTRTTGGVLTGPGVRHNLRLVSKAFVLGGKNLVLTSGAVILLGSPLTYESTYFVMEIETGAIVGRALPGLAIRLTEKYGQLSQTAVSGTDAYVAGHYMISGSQEAAALVYITPQIGGRWAEVAGTTLLPGSSIYQYDGTGVSELGFHFPPRITGGSVIAGSMAAGNYYYRATWAWVDAVGRLHESAPCFATQLTLGAPGGLRVTVLTLGVTLKSAPLQNAFLRLWRSPVNPSSAGNAEMYLVATRENDPSVDSLVIDDAMVDATLITGEKLYTLGSAVSANAPAPPASELAVWGDRVWAADRDVVWFSRVIQDGLGVAFQSESFIQINDEHGDITAVSGNGPRFVAFKSRAIYTWSGEGPSDTGQGSFSPVKKLPEPLGARSSKSVVSTELGVFFQDDDSGQIWLLPPEGVPQAIGLDVEDIAPALTISDAVVVPDKRQVRFVSEEGSTLVYDLVHKQWSVNTGQAATSCATVNGVFHYVTSAGLVLYDDPSTWVEAKDAPGAEAGVAYKMALETTWLSLNKVAGYKRVLAVVATGENKGTHILTAKLGYRFGNIEETRTVSSAVISSDAGYRVEARPHIKQQHASAVRVRYEDNSPATAGFALESLLLVLGIRDKRERLPKVNQAT